MRIIIALLLPISFISNLYATPHAVQLNIIGIKNPLLLDNIRGYLSIGQKHPQLSTGRIKGLHKRAKKEIKRALQAFGYYHVTVRAKLKRLQPKIWRATYIIKLGKTITITKLDIQILGAANNDKNFQQLKFPLAVGEIFKHLKYKQAKQLLRQLAEERGYFHAKFQKHEIRVDKQTYSAEISLIFDSKKRYRFGKVIFPKDWFDESLLQRYVTFKTGDFYTSSKFLAFKNALMYSGYFDKVDVDILRLATTENQRLPIKVKLGIRKKHKYAIGLGYGTNTGARGSLEWKRRYLNRYGHKFSIKATQAEIGESAIASYTVPKAWHQDELFSITALYKNEHIRASDSKIFALGVNKNHKNKIIGIKYHDETYTIGSDSGHAKLLIPSINWSYINADDRIYTRQGHKLTMDVLGAINNIGSNTSFLQFRLDGKLIHPLFNKGRIITRGQFAYSFVSLVRGEFNDLPPSIRFFAGGDRSIRGYDYQSLGPKNTEGIVIGGKNLFIGSIEYEYQILDKYYLAAFYDVGNAFNDFSDPIKHGIGLGVRWRSPVGLIRFDVATALEEEGFPLRLHITIGPDL
ncbi:autotransporter assembly complex protein TamA [Candidatus Marithrix sp. Canyon 246]|uniref:autotransporter assembly complex protein TamA n=1 Tax=Candidatus Marithrix sp. Canyon 246 TaxID=1827136 RepID=UPI00084A228D|nr:autotransporter assembly complex family protein [Candidatus Marithrix sp. Canyon 246]